MLSAGGCNGVSRRAFPPEWTQGARDEEKRHRLKRCGCMQRRDKIGEWYGTNTNTFMILLSANTTTFMILLTSINNVRILRIFNILLGYY